MKMLFISAKYTGGTGRAAYGIAKKLRQCGFDIKLMHASHIPVKNLKSPSFALFGTIKAICQQEKFDIVHAFGVPSAFPMRCCNSKKKVFAMYGVYSEQMGIMHSGAIGSLAKGVEIRVMKWADKLTTDSRAVQRRYKEKFNLDFECLYGPSDPEEFRHIPEVKKKKRQVICLGRDSYEKGIDILRSVEPRINGDVVYCTGLRWEDAMVKLKESQLIVVPSRMESSPQVIREAFYLKVPVVATSVGDVTELITNNENGILVEPDSPEDLLSAVNAMLDNRDAHKFAEKGYDFLMKNRTWDVLLPKYVKFYEDLIRSP